MRKNQKYYNEKRDIILKKKSETFTCPDCAGEGQVECGECSGDGEVDCPSCSYGKLTCNECDGNGEVSNNEFEYFEHFIVNWNRLNTNKC